MLNGSFIFAVLCLFGIGIFVSALPSLKRCRLPISGFDSTVNTFRLRSDMLPVILVTVLYSFTAFYNLGDREAPQSFVPMENKTVVLSLVSADSVSQLAIYPGAGTGEYLIESSSDQEGWLPVSSFSQDHVAVLKWAYLPLNLDSSVRFLRLICVSGNPFLGEVAVLDSNTTVLPLASTEELLVDEQNLVARSSSFLNSSYFDEIYHVRTAWEHLKGLWPYEISHPPLGKELISIGVLLFGMTPFGWRFSGTVSGILMLPVMYLFIKRIFGSRRVALLGMVLLATGFLHYVQTRIATIDCFAVLFIMLMYYHMYGWLTTERVVDLAWCGIFFGIGCACKWICLYAGAGLALIWILHWMHRFHEEGNGAMHPFLKNVLVCVVFFLVIPTAIYYLSYLPYGKANGIEPFSSAFSQMVLENQRFMFQYHSSIVAEHPYSSRWYQWILNLRPILYYLEYLPGGKRVSIAAFVNPLICWGGLLCVPILIYLLLCRKDKIAGFLLIGYFSGLIPWMFITRLTFEYHYFASAVFLVLMLTYLFWILEKNTSHGNVFTFAFTAASLALFICFFPVLNGLPVLDTLSSKLLGWLPTWPI